jgi:hypothetical protein
MLKKVLPIMTLVICGWMTPSANAACVELPNPTFFQSLNVDFDKSAPWCEVSLSLQYNFEWQTDGNLVLYSPSGPTWSSRTNGKGQFISIQGDGNLVIYNASGAPLWASNTDGDNDGDEYLTAQGDGNTVIYEAGVAKWDTAHHPVP